MHQRLLFTPHRAYRMLKMLFGKGNAVLNCIGQFGPQVARSCTAKNCQVQQRQLQRPLSNVQNFVGYIAPSCTYS